MTDLPDPLVPPEVDVRSFPFMPLYIVRLRTSRAWLRCKRNPALAFYMLNLWTAAWHNKPAGSIDDDPDVLADAAMCRDDETFEVFRDEILRGWIKCSDGRLYHPVVAEQVIIAWQSKCARQSQTEAARLAREAKRRVNATVSVTENATGDVTGSNRHRHLTEQERDLALRAKERTPRSSAGSKPKSAIQPKAPTHSYPTNAFTTFYAKFPRKKARPAAERAFRKIEAADDIAFEDLLKGIDAFWRDNPDVAFWPYPASWLSGRRWEDDPAPNGKMATASADEQPRIDFGGGVRWPETTVRATVARWRSDPSTWPQDRLGPPPKSPGCRVPDHLLRMAA